MRVCVQLRRIGSQAPRICSARFFSSAAPPRVGGASLDKILADFELLPPQPSNVAHTFHQFSKHGSDPTMTTDPRCEDLMVCVREEALHFNNHDLMRVWSGLRQIPVRRICDYNGVMRDLGTAAVASVRDLRASDLVSIVHTMSVTGFVKSDIHRVMTHFILERVGELTPYDLVTMFTCLSKDGKGGGGGGSRSVATDLGKALARELVDHDKFSTLDAFQVATVARALVELEVFERKLADNVANFIAHGAAQFNTASLLNVLEFAAVFRCAQMDALRALVSEVISRSHLFGSAQLSRIFEDLATLGFRESEARELSGLANRARQEFHHLPTERIVVMFRSMVKMQMRDAGLLEKLAGLTELSKLKFTHKQSLEIVNYVAELQYREKDFQSWLRDQIQTVTEPYRTENFKMMKGDWLCPDTACAAHNFSRLKQCHVCGTDAPRSVREHQKTYNLKPMMAGDWKCVACDFHNYAKNSKCKKCTAPHPKKQSEEGQSESENMANYF